MGGFANVNGAMGFDGITGYVNMGSAISLVRDFTLECYVYISRDIGGLFGQGVGTTGAGLHILWYILLTRGMIFGMHGNDLDTPSYNLQMGTWNHFAFTYSNTTFLKQFYANGVLINSITGTAYSGTGQLNIGANYSAPSNFFNGKISNAKMYSRVLSAAEVLQNSNYMSSGLTFDSTTQGSNFDTMTESGRLISVSSYTTAGSYPWYKTAGATKIVVKVVGGGGGAAGYCESGGSGGYSEKTIDATGIASNVTVTVGGGGGVVGYYTAGGTGGTSSFGSYCSATGGYGSNANVAHTGGHGGTGSSGDINLSGGNGTGHINSMGHGQIGRGGESYWGGSSSVNRNVSPYTMGNGAPGAGGTGVITDSGTQGTSGEAGAVMIWEYQ